MLSRDEPDAFVEMNPVDGRRLGVRDRKPVRVISRRGEIIAGARLTEAVPEKMVFIPFHFHEAPANILTHNKCDPVARIPEFKVCAVRLEKVQ